ncbi:MAG: hypothetical protein GTO22_14500 [Gemmatimonadales bacterium]|nr:hypothetical protein [Gemmatimonadales bacterium]
MAVSFDVPNTGVPANFEIRHGLGEDFTVDITVRDGPKSTDTIVDTTGATFLFTARDNVRAQAVLYATRTGAGQFEVVAPGTNSPNARLTIASALTGTLDAADDYDFDMWMVLGGLRTLLASGKYRLRPRQTAEATFP